ncbi:MAG: FAD-dependent oxidoreductase [Hyphomonadaceae bacterium]|nr:FAD-dependent oxidoreductase [Hyphomonadaceae bacterium]
MRDYAVDLCVIGAGSAGLSVAAGAVQLGLSVVLFESGAMGGDCLNAGCVPSKALIAAAQNAQVMRTAARFGLAAVEPRIDWAQVKAHIKGVIAAIEPNDSQHRFEKLGVTVIRERAHFADARTVVSDSARARAKRFVIATGSRAAAPPIPGLEEVAYETNETIFDLPTFPERLLILGGGPIGVELGQAFRRLGARVTIVEAARVLGALEEEAAHVVRARLVAEGIDVLEGQRVEGARRAETGVVLTVSERRGAARDIVGSHLLVAAGRKPNLENLGLEQAGIAFDKIRVTTSPTLRSTTNDAVWALGDAAGGGFTHTAGWHASVWVRNVLFKARTAANALAMPAAVFTDPEIAQIGLTEAQARERHGRAVKTTRWDFHDNDRAQAQRDTEGFCKLVLGRGGAILGATVVGAEAGEIIAPIALAMANKLTVRALTNPVLPYPTRSEIVKRAAGAHFTPTLFSSSTRALVGVLKRLP